VGADVIGKVIASTEGLRAVGALVGPFARVGADVPDKVIASVGGKFAVCAFMLA
jgi:hypothetical protein